MLLPAKNSMFSEKRRNEENNESVGNIVAMKTKIYSIYANACLKRSMEFHFIQMGYRNYQN